jgi:DtxR family transcriptional regulator, Mn-dependent transcriptional regulator
MVTMSRATEDYLKAIYHLAHRGEPVTTGQLAQELGVSAPSVSAMVKRLEDGSLLTRPDSRTLQLTASGERAALRVVRRHRLLETFLVNELGYGWDEVHDEAEILEHVVSDKFVDRIAAHLGNPVVDPHGDPIPTREGTIVERESVLLAEAEAGTSGVIVRVNDTDPELLRYLADIDIGIGMRVEVVERLPFAGSLQLSVRPEKGGDARDQALGLVAAEALWLSPDGD